MICWKEIKEALQEEIPRGTFYLWFSDVEGEFKENVLYLYTKTENVARRIASRYMENVRAVLQRFFREIPTVEVLVAESSPRKEAKTVSKRVVDRDKKDTLIQDGAPVEPNQGMLSLDFLLKDCDTPILSAFTNEVSFSSRSVRRARIRDKVSPARRSTRGVVSYAKENEIAVEQNVLRDQQDTHLLASLQKKAEQQARSIDEKIAQQKYKEGVNSFQAVLERMTKECTSHPVTSEGYNVHGVSTPATGEVPLSHLDKGTFLGTYPVVKKGTPTQSPQEQYSLFPSSCGVDIPYVTQYHGEEQGYMDIFYPARQKQFLYTYASFIVGKCNKLAHESSLAVCTGFDPNASSLYVSAAPGLGKTHLVQAVGNQLLSSSNVHSLRIEYLSAEEFTSQFTLAMQQKKLSEFLTRLKNLDVLLLEDVHFLQGKEKIQFHLLSVIKALQARQSRIVVSSSFSLKDIRNIDPQLASCFQQGYVAHILEPDLHFRREVIQKKATAHQVKLPEPVVELIAETVCTDIRQIESCLKTLILKARSLSEDITVNMALEVLAAYNTKDTTLSFDEIVKYVCTAFGISKERLQSKTRQQECVLARNIIFYVARLATDMTLKEVASQFNRQHSTVIKGISSIESEVSKETPKAQQIRTILSHFEAPSVACL